MDGLKEVIRFVGTAVSRPQGLDVSRHGLTGESCPVVNAENDFETVRIIVSCHGDLWLLILVAQVSHVRNFEEKESWPPLRSHHHESYSPGVETVQVNFTRP